MEYNGQITLAVKGILMSYEYVPRGHGEEGLDWKRALETSGVVVIDTLAPTKFDRETLTPAFTAAHPDEAEMDKAKTALYARSRAIGSNGSVSAEAAPLPRERSAGYIAYTDALGHLKKLCAPFPIVDMALELPELAPSMNLADKVAEMIDAKIDELYEVILSGRFPAPYVLPFELNANPKQDGLGLVSTQIMIAVARNQQKLYEAQAKGELLDVNALPVFIVKNPNPYTQSGAVLADTFPRYAGSQNKALYINTRSFTNVAMAEFLTKSGDFGEVAPDHPVVQEVTDENGRYGGDANLVFWIRKMGSEIYQSHFAYSLGYSDRLPLISSPERGESQEQFLERKKIECLEDAAAIGISPDDELLTRIMRFVASTKAFEKQPSSRTANRPGLAGLELSADPELPFPR